MGVKASILVAIDMLKGLLCGFDGSIPLTKNDCCFDKKGEIDDKRFGEYLMQEDNNEDELKTKACLALA